MKQAGMIPEHELIRCIGSGSYGSVWLARNATGAWRAVKVVWRESFRDERPFEREWTGVRRFESLSRESDAFVDILQTGRASDGSFFYYVMELADDMRARADARACGGPVGGDVEGYQPRTLSRDLREGGRMTATACAALGGRLARGLACLHGAGLLHRDIKPSNIVFVGGEPRLADIGLVTDMGEARSYVGTDGYIPVEGPNSPQADVYGLGKVVYEAMTGLDRMEFPRVPRGFGEGAEGRRLLALNAVVLKACAASREMRHASAGAMAQDMDAVAGGGATRAGVGVMAALAGFLGAAGGTRAALAALALLAALAGGWAWRPRWGDGVLGKAVGAVNSDAWVAAEDPRRPELLRRGLRSWDEGDEAGALVWLAEAMGEGGQEGPGGEEDRVRAAELMAGLPVPEATLDVGVGVYSAAFSPDGTRVATCHKDGAVQIWEVKPPGMRVGGPWDAGGHAARVRFSADGKTLWLSPAVDQPALRGLDGIGRAVVMDAASGRVLATPLRDVLWAVFSDDGRWVAGVGASNGVVLADVRGGGDARVLDRHARAVSWLAFSPDGGRLASASDDGTARVWRLGALGDGARVLSLEGMGSSVAFDGTGRRLGTLAWDGGQQSSFEEWDVEHGGARIRRDRLPGPARGLEWLGGPRAGFMIAALRHGFRLKGPGAEDLFHAGLGGTRALAWGGRHDGRFVVAGCEDGTVRVWRIEDGLMVSQIPHGRQAVVAVGFSPDGGRILAATEDGLMRTWSGWVGRGGERRELPGMVWGEDVVDRADVAAALDPNAGLLVAAAREDAGGGGIVVVTSLTNEGDWHMTRMPPGQEVGRFRRSSDGKWWAGHGWAVVMPRTPSSVWLGHRGEQGWSSHLLPHPTWCRDVGFEPAGERLTTLDDSFVWRRWDMKSRAQESQQALHVSDAVQTTLSPDGRVVALTTADRQRMELWSWDDVFTLHASWRHDRIVNRADFLPGSPWMLIEDPVRNRSIIDQHTGKAVPIPAGALDGGRAPEWNPAARRFLHVLESSSVAVLDMAALAVRRWSHPPDRRGARHAVLSQTGRWAAVVDREEGVRWVEALSGRPLSRRIVPGGRVRWIGFMGDSSLVILSDPNCMQVETLSPWQGHGASLRDWASLVSGRRLDSGGSIEWLRPADMARLASRVARP